MAFLFWVWLLFGVPTGADSSNCRMVQESTGGVVWFSVACGAPAVPSRAR